MLVTSILDTDWLAAFLKRVPTEFWVISISPPKVSIEPRKYPTSEALK